MNWCILSYLITQLCTGYINRVYKHHKWRFRNLNVKEILYHSKKMYTVATFSWRVQRKLCKLGFPTKCNKENKIKFHINWKIRVKLAQENRERESEWRNCKRNPSDKEGLKQVGPTVKNEMFQNVPLIMRPAIMFVYTYSLRSPFKLAFG